MPTRAVLADTGPLFAAADPHDNHHRRAQSDIERLAHSGLAVIILHSTLSEAYSLVLYKLGLRVARAWLTELSERALLVAPTAEDYHQASVLLHRYADQRLSLFDAVLATTAQRLEVPIWAYDHHFEIVGAIVWRPG